MTKPFNDLAAMEKALCKADVAAVLIETIPATCGFPVPDPAFLPNTKRGNLFGNKKNGTVRIKHIQSR